MSTSPTGKKPCRSPLNQKQQIALDALLRGASTVHAAKEAGVARETVSRWRNTNPDFIAAFNAASSDMWSGTIQELRSLGQKAVQRLGELLHSDDDVISLRAVTMTLQALGVGADAKESLAPPSRSFAPHDSNEVRKRWAKNQEREDEKAVREMQRKRRDQLLSIV